MLGCFLSIALRSLGYFGFQGVRTVHQVVHTHIKTQKAVLGGLMQISGLTSDHVLAKLP